MAYTLEPMTAAHRFSVVEIFNHYIQEGFAAYPEAPLPMPFFDRFLEMLCGYPAFVARTDSGEVAGFATLRPYHPASSFRRTAEVTYFIHPAHTRKGLGRVMLERLMAEAKGRGIDTFVASISSRNEASLAFHRKQGFGESGRLKGIGRKFGQEFDVVWMQRRIDG